MLHAESKLGPQKSNNFEWSPTLKRAIQAQRYWALCLKQAKELAVSSECLKQHREAAELMEHDPLLLLDTIKRLQKASATLKAFQKQHRSFRSLYLEELAESIVLDQSPNLYHDSMAQIKANRIQTQIRKLIKRENMRGS